VTGKALDGIVVSQILKLLFLSGSISSTSASIIGMNETARWQF